MQLESLVNRHTLWSLLTSEVSKANMATKPVTFVPNMPVSRLEGQNMLCLCGIFTHTHLCCFTRLMDFVINWLFLISHTFCCHNDLSSCRNFIFAFSSCFTFKLIFGGNVVRFCTSVVDSWMNLSV